MGRVGARRETAARPMRAVTARLVSAAKAGDPRLRALREFGGTTDGVRTHGFDLSTGRESFGEWDDSHLWHVHLSVYRAYANDAATLSPIASVMVGGPATQPSPVSKPTAADAAGWPLPPGHYFGLITGPDECHGGINAAERDLGAEDPAAPAGSWLCAQDSRLGRRQIRGADQGCGGCLATREVRTTDKPVRGDLVRRLGSPVHLISWQRCRASG